jgi:hypothetical protein
MPFYNDRVFSAGKVPIRQEVRKVFALPLPIRQTPEVSPPAPPVEVPQWAENGITFDWFNPASNSFAPTPNFAVEQQLKRQAGVRSNIDHHLSSDHHSAVPDPQFAGHGKASAPSEGSSKSNGFVETPIDPFAPI